MKSLEHFALLLFNDLATCRYLFVDLLGEGVDWQLLDEHGKLVLLLLDLLPWSHQLD